MNQNKGKKKMKNKQTTIVLCASALSMFCCACHYVAPTPLENENAPALVEPLPFYRNMQVFSEKNVPLCYTVSASGSSQIAELVKNSLRRSNAVLVEAGTPCDLQLKVSHNLKSIKITSPTTQTRYSLDARVTMNFPTGGTSRVLWQTEVSDQKAYSSAEAAQNALTTQLEAKLNGKELLANAERTLGVSILRIATSRDMVEFDANRFEADITTALNELRKINGVLNVRMIEADKNNRTVSFRVLYSKSALPAGISAKLRESK